MSIRLRLTLLYTAILGVTLVVFALFVYALLAHNLLRQIDSSLSDGASASARLPRLLAPSASEPERTEIGRVLAARNGTLPSVAPFPAPDMYVQYVDSNGAVLARSAALASADITLPAPHGQPLRRSYQTVRLSGQDLRLLIEPLGPARGSGITLEVARPLTDVRETEARLRVVLAFGVIGALVLAGVTGWVLARVALRPIDRLTQTAHEIGQAQDFSRRVSYQGPRDEVGRLAGTFNEMLSRLQASYARIQRALEAQRRFVADASHELRTPLTTIRGNVELLELDDESESSDRREALHDIASEAERMSRLVADLLALARADAGMHVQRVPISVQPLVEQVCRQVGRTSGSVGIRLEQMPDVTVSGSADHLRQLLLILLDNACKFSPEGGVVRVHGEESGGWLRLSVSDEGPGIPIEEQERIFDRFYRLDTSRHGEGSGLGLAIARWIATEHDGRLSVESAPGQGSTFTLVVPLAESSLPRAVDRAPAAIQA